MDAHARRRQRFLSRIEEGVALFGSAPVRTRSHDVHYRYRQDSNQLYLTGFEEPESWTILTKLGGEERFAMVVRPQDPEREVWDGWRAGPEGAVSRYGADEAHPLEKLEETLVELLGKTDRLYYKLGRNPAQDQVIFRVLERLGRMSRDGIHPPHTLIDPGVVLDEMRLVKTGDDLGPVRRAVEISVEAHIEAMRAAWPGRHEYELQAVLEYVFLLRGAPDPGYPSIVGSGPNATILHYRENRRRMEDGDLVLVDAGAEYDGFSADITRTFPVNGRFSDAQRAVYDVVLEAQRQAIATVRPGTRFDEVHAASTAVIVDGLRDLGLLEGSRETILEEKTYKKFFMHRTSHWLGMDVHDVGRYRSGETWRELQPGMILTIEPGIYIGTGLEGVPDAYRGIGVRIEDDVLVTAMGSEVLTAEAPKDPAQIEDAMRSPSRHFLASAPS